MAATVPVVAAASIDQRFAQLIQQFGLTKNSFAISLGKTASVVQHLIDGRNKPGFDLMCKVFEIYPNVSRDWLLLGRGPMLVGSNGAVAAPMASAEAKKSEPGFEPIDLADVAPRAARRMAGNRLHPDEIAAALALATAVGEPSAVTSVPVSAPATAGQPVGTTFSESNSADALPAAPLLPGAALELSAPPVVSPTMQRSAQPFRPVSRHVSEPVAPLPGAAGAAPFVPEAGTPGLPAVAASASLGELLPSSQPVPTALGGPEAYVAAAMHAQHLQHQLALAELRNQHLLEQQQMLREMLAMARQSMV